MSSSNYTQQDPADSASEYASRQYQIDQTLAHVRTIVQVKVLSVSGGGASAPATVSVQPLVKIVDGNGNVSSHGTINNIPVSRIGSGNGAIVVDPVVGDTGWMAIADRDSSVVQSSNGSESQPGSRRMFDLADGVYVGKLFGGAAEQYLLFDANGMHWHDKNANEIISSSTGISINGVMFNRSGQVQGNLAVTGNVISNPGAAQVTLQGHISVNSTTPPTPGH